MTSDLQSTRLAADGSVFGGPVRVKAIWAVCGASAGSIVLKDGGASGASTLTIDTPGSATATLYIDLPESGVHFVTNCYADITNVTALTVFYA